MPSTAASGALALEREAAPPAHTLVIENHPRGDNFNPADVATWLTRGRSPEHAEALAQAWRDFPDLPTTASIESRMARTRERVQAMRPINDAIAAAAETERQRRNFRHVECRAKAGTITVSDQAILRGRDAHGYDWDAAICYSQGWYAAHAGWPHGKPSSTRAMLEHRTAYDRGFADGGGDPSDLFDAARRSIVAADRSGAQAETDTRPLQSRPLPSSWPKPSDNARPARWNRRLLILAEDPEFAGAATSMVLDQVLARPEAEQLNIILLTGSGFVVPSHASGAKPLTSVRCRDLMQNAEQTAALRDLTAGLPLDDILIAAQGDALAVIDAHSSALPLCRTMERTRNTVLQQRQHLRIWLDRAATSTGNVGAGHIRWSKLAQGLAGKLGEFTARYAGKAASGRGHTIVVETAPGVPARGYVTADGDTLDPHIAFGNKARMRQEMATALRAFGGATRLTPMVASRAV